MTKLRIGTRSSRLALTQTHLVKQALLANRLVDESSIEIVTISTQGDQTAGDDKAMPSQPGFFVKEIERALLDDKIDIAVHSLKDLPSQIDTNLTLAAFLTRENPCDVFCAADPAVGEQIYHSLISNSPLPSEMVIGTSSPRRVAMARHHCANVLTKPIRGNVDTRLKKLDGNQYQAVILAAAGLARLGLKPSFSKELPIDVFVPAAGQGIVTIECKKSSQVWIDILKQISDPDATNAALAEKEFMHVLGASCLTPVGVYASIVENDLKMNAALFSPDGKTKITHSLAGSIDEACKLGGKLAECILDQGGRSIVEAQR